jgi:eukaryotic-like serine/threonine-protein kinase
MSLSVPVDKCSQAADGRWDGTMRCPHCHADNAEGAARCASCGLDFGSVHDAPTFIGHPASDSSASPEMQKTMTAVGVASPPPGSTPSAFSSGSAGAPALAFAATFEPGTDFGPRYRIEALLGRGGMGAVYKAYDKELDRPVALKLVRPDLTSDPGAQQRFKQELLLASKISHKNVLRIHDLGDVGGVKFISMAYVEGEDLQHRLTSQGRLPVSEVVSLARQLLSALEAAQAEGVVHRDMKPQNVLLDRAGNAYISDFGLAKSLEGAAAVMTRTGEVLGTPRYMSPEQVEGKPADHRSDLYSLGLIFYEMLTGEAPFTGSSAFQLMYQRLRERPKDVKQVNPEVPDYLARVVMRCLERDPEARYQNAREVLNDLDAERASASLSRSVRITVPMPAGRGWLVAGAVVLLLAVALALPPVRRALFERHAAPTTEVGIPPLSQGKHLAVLPLRVLGDQAALGYLAQGVQEALSAKLFQLKGVQVSSSSSVEPGETLALDKIGRELGANLILDGMVQGAPDRMRIILNLENVPENRRVWSGEFSGMSDDLLTLEDQIYGKVVAALELNPGASETSRAALHPTENLQAYDLYLRGRNAMRQQQDSKSVQQAIEDYQQAIGKDPNFALAYAGLADSSLRMYEINRENLWAQRALGAAQQAEQLNDNLPEVHTSLGDVYQATGKEAQAIVELDRALELARNSDSGWRRLGNAYLKDGRKDDGFRALEKAIEINPYFWLNYNALGNAYFQTGDNDKALEAFRHVTELEPDNAAGWENEGAIYFRQGKWNDAVDAFQKALGLQQSSDIYSNLGTTYFYLKRYDDAVKTFEKALALSPSDQSIAGNLADAYRWDGQPKKAIDTYNKAIGLAFKELEVNPRNADTLGLLALYFAKKGEPQKGLEYIQHARQINKTSVELMYNETVVETLAGKTDLALQSLAQALKSGYSLEDVENDPELKVLRDTSQFAALMEQSPGPGKSN